MAAEWAREFAQQHSDPQTQQIAAAGDVGSKSWAQEFANAPDEWEREWANLLVHNNPEAADWVEEFQKVSDGDEGALERWIQEYGQTPQFQVQSHPFTK